MEAQAGVNQALGLTIRIVVEKEKGLLTHRIEQPRSMKLEYAPDGIETGLRIDDALGRSTLLTFRVSTVPETLDGLAPAEI